MAELRDNAQFQFPKPVVAEANGVRVLLVPSAALVSEEEAGDIVVTSSHGGVSAGEYASQHPVRMAFFNDAGFGREDAGVAGIQLLQDRGIAAGAVAHTSARIGDPDDTWASGVISRLNQLALDAGLREGEPLQQEVLNYLQRQQPTSE
jgi:hypothetical protein